MSLWRLLTLLLLCYFFGELVVGEQVGGRVQRGLLLLRGASGEVCFSGRFVRFGLLLWVGFSSFSAIGGRWIVPAVSFGSGVPVATTADFVPVVSSLVDGGGRRGWGMLFVSAVGLASSGGLVSFYFRVSGSVAGCGGSFPSPVSMMADLLGVFLFLRW